MNRRLVAGALTAAAGAVLVPVVVISTLMSTPPPPVPALKLAGASSGCVVPVAMPKIPTSAGALTEAQVTKLAIGAGWRGDDVAIAVAVARAESAWRPTATLLNTNGSTDHGLFQINSVHAAILASGNWRDPADNARMAYTVWKQSHGGSWQPWVTYKTGSYRKFLRSTPAVAPAAGCTPQIGDGTGACKVVKGNWPNGQIPASALCVVKFDKRHRLRADSANALVRLNTAYRAQFGHNLCFTDSYRSLDVQKSLAVRKPGLAAVPGTSNHGWGLAIDLCLPGVRPFEVGTPEDRWMNEFGPKYGWVLPTWARPGGSRPENWHRGFLDGVHTP